MAVVIVECSQGSTGGQLHNPRYVGVPVREDRVFDGDPIHRVKIRKTMSVRKHGSLSDGTRADHVII